MDVVDVLNILLCVDLELFDVEFLGCNDTADIISEAFPFWILRPNDSLNQVRKCRLVFIILDHTESSKRAEFETSGLLVGVVHVISKIQNEAKDVHQSNRIS